MTDPPRGRPDGPVSAGSLEAESGMKSIGDVAREFAITTRTIRFYESRGLIKLHRKGAARAFSAADREQLGLILKAKNLGLTLEEIGEHLCLYRERPTDERRLMALRSRAEAQISLFLRKRADLAATLEELRAKRREILAELRRLRVQAKDR